MIGPDLLEQRRKAWSHAEEIVTPLLEKHGIEEYRSTHAVFVPTTPVTKIEQHLDAIERVATWLLDFN